MSRLLWIASLMLALISTSAFSRWDVENDVDAMTDRATVVARSTNSEGHRVSIYRRDDGSVWMNFRISDASFDLLSPQVAPMFRVDDRKAHNLGDVKRLQELVPSLPKGYFWEPKWINVRIWDGSNEKGRSSELADLMTGERAVFRYFLSTGGSRDTRFDLAGARDAIAKAAGIEGQLDALGGAEHLASALAAERKACEANAVNEDFAVCAARYERCRIDSSGSMESFRACVKP